MTATVRDDDFGGVKSAPASTKWHVRIWGAESQGAGSDRIGYQTPCRIHVPVLVWRKTIGKEISQG